MKLVSSIVLYRNSQEIVERAMKSFLEKDSTRHIVLVDHSPNPILSNLATISNTSYIHNPKNPGFGAGHNLAHNSKNNAPLDEKYIVIQNPDVFIEPGCINHLLNKLESDPSIGLITCKVLNPDGSIQRLLKKDPNLLALVARRIPFLTKLKFFKKALEHYEIEDNLYEVEGNIPIVSGCFFIIPKSVWNAINGFDERYFLYFEDFDLCRKVKSLGKRIVYCPDVQITHLWTRGAHSSNKHLFYFVRSMIQYFNKWGWKFW